MKLSLIIGLLVLCSSNSFAETTSGEEDNNLQTEMRSVFNLPITSYISSRFPEARPSIGCQLSIDPRNHVIWFTVLNEGMQPEIPNFGTSFYQIPSLPIQDDYRNVVRVDSNLSYVSYYRDGRLVQETSSRRRNENGEVIESVSRLSYKVDRNLTTFEEATYQESSGPAGGRLQLNTDILCSHSSSNQPMS